MFTVAGVDGDGDDSGVSVTKELRSSPSAFCYIEGKRVRVRNTRDSVMSTSSQPAFFSRCSLTSRRAATKIQAVDVKAQSVVNTAGPLSVSSDMVSEHGEKVKMVKYLKTRRIMENTGC